MKTFEQRLERLEEINESMKSPELPLESALSLFEEGIALAKELEKNLKKAEQRVEILTNAEADEDEEPEFELVSE